METNTNTTTVQPNERVLRVRELLAQRQAGLIDEQTFRRLSNLATLCR